MSFSYKIKEELKSKIDSAKHCQISELAAILGFCGSIDENSLTLTTENTIVSEKYIELIGKIFDISEDDMLTTYEGRNSGIIHVAINKKEEIDRICATLKIHEMSEIKGVVHPLVIQKECCKRAFIRGAFLAAGSVSDPKKFYHFEIVCDYEEYALQVKEVFDFFKLEAKVIQRKNSYIVYIKEGNHITDCLNIMGAYVSQMDLYNVMILKGISNNVNRIVNCETANLNKTVEAAVKQIRDIEYIRDTVGLDYLKDNLKQTAIVRLENPDMNLKDIGDRLEPPVGKSGVNHRLRKISEIADELRENK